MPASPNTAAALDVVRQRGRNLKLKWLAKIAVGLATIWIAPLLVAAFSIFILWNFGVDVPVKWTFLGIFAGWIVLLLATEYKHRGGFFDERIVESSPTPGGMLWAKADLLAFFANPRMGAAGTAEVMLFPGRQLLDVVDEQRKAKALSRVDPAHAAAVLATLLRRDKSVAIADLRKEHGDATDGAIAWLLFHDVGTDGNDVV
ncbi:MAG: hypothetical protein AAGK78_13365, partial [Planctomycetota bacterium]